MEAQGLRRIHRQGTAEIHAVHDTDMTVRVGEFLTIMGPSGSGKSSLLYLLGGLDRPDQGSVTIDGMNLSAMNEDELSLFRRRHLGFVLQFFNLMPTLTALENVALPLELDGRRDAATKARAMLEQVGLAHRGHHRPSQLSGGEQQRVALARALVTSPALILADEPTGNLDSTTGKEILELMAGMAQDGQTIVMATHAASAAQFATRTVRLADGAVVKEASR